ncbi:MAG: PLD nuclease N-terminal domain-containing protein [Clostridiales bacterium]
MFDSANSGDILKLVLPILIFQLSIQLYCLFIILKKGVANLNKTLWIIIVFLTNLFGPIIFLLVGRKKDND